MASVNKVIIIGNLGQDPDIRYSPSGDAICNVSIATSETWKDKQTGDKREQTEWHRVVFFGKLAEIAGQYLKKGRSVYVEGSLHTRKWQDKNGQDRYTTEIRANEMKMLGDRGEGGDSQEQRRPLPHEDGQRSTRRQQPTQDNGATSNTQPSSFGDFDDDIPF